MKIPKPYTERLLLKPLEAEDASQIQVPYPRWEIVRYMASSVPWPYPDNGVENHVNNATLPDMEKGIVWIWTIRFREAPDALVGLICLYDVGDNSRGFWLVPEYQEQGFMCEASNVAMDYWFNTLNRMVLRTSKAPPNIRPIHISDSSGTWPIKMEKKEYVNGLLDPELREIMRDEWNACRAGQNKLWNVHNRTAENLRSSRRFTTS